jgi:hypothetical protein
MAKRVLIWVLALLVILLLLSLMFGGFRKGTKVGLGACACQAVRVTAGGLPTGSGVSRG